MVKKILSLLLFIVLIFFVVAPSLLEKQFNLISKHAPFIVSEEAQKLHRNLFIGDLHADSTLWDRNLSNQHNFGHVDIPRLQKGNVALQMFTTVSKVPQGLNYERNETSANDRITALAVIQGWPVKTWNNLTERVIYQAKKIQRIAKKDSDNFMLVLSQSDLEKFINKRKSNPNLVGGLIGTEGSHALEGNLDNIQRLYSEGFRMMSLQHFFDNKLGGSLHGTTEQGLTKFGQEAIYEMLRLKIIIDVSHSSENVVKDVLNLTTQPLLVSHTGFNGHCPSPRNIDDSLMKEIAARGGLIGIGYWDAAVCGNTPREVASAIQFGIKLVGVEHVALGSDFDGAVLSGFDTSELIALTHELLEAGIEEPQIRLVMGENLLHFFERNLPTK
ncbi:MAG TPA: peptidase M19 [Gammaproteobacteria bacterium]|nr:peptidase M19 [Gammaproteobacteria bacterium]HIK77646.1 peptidase M19 [Gammaproteobacteria bacterium]